MPDQILEMMAYQSFEKFKDVPLETLKTYCEDYTIFKPTHYTFATSLITEVESIKDPSALLKMLFGAYQNLLESSNSIKLFRHIAIILARQLDVSKRELDAYLKKRASSITYKKWLEIIPHDTNPQTHYNSRTNNEDLIETAIHKQLKNYDSNYFGPHYKVTMERAREITSCKKH